MMTTPALRSPLGGIVTWFGQRSRSISKQFNRIQHAFLGPPGDHRAVKMATYAGLAFMIVPLAQRGRREDFAHVPVGDVIDVASNDEVVR